MNVSILRETVGGGLQRVGVELRGDGLTMLSDGNAEYPGAQLIENLGDKIIWLADKILPPPPHKEIIDLTSK